MNNNQAFYHDLILDGTISGKDGTTNTHIDNMLKETPTKLQVSVKVADEDWNRIQDMFTNSIATSVFDKQDEKERMIKKLCKLSVSRCAKIFL